MKRMTNQHYSAYSHETTASFIYVKCPKCSGLGIITLDHNAAYFKCTNCGNSKSKERTVYHYEIHNQCKACGKFYKADIKEESKQHFHTLHVACPYCGCMMPGKVQKTVKACNVYGEIKKAIEPFWGLELWFSTSFNGKPIWAVNREHLSYLISYLSADLREKPLDLMSVKTQADHLPTFMKTAKHRDRIVRLLKNLQQR